MFKKWERLIGKPFPAFCYVTFVLEAEAGADGVGALERSCRAVGII